MAFTRFITVVVVVVVIIILGPSQILSNIQNLLPAAWFLTMFSKGVRLLLPLLCSRHVLVNVFFYYLVDSSLKQSSLSLPEIFNVHVQLSATTSFSFTQLFVFGL
jgi:hypothetical protein